MKRFIFSALIVVLGSTTLHAQEQFKHEKKMYKSPQGRLYINKVLPVYVWVSTSPDPNAPKQRLESEDSRAYVNPLYFDTEGYNTVRTPSKVDTITKKPLIPLQDIIFEVYADSYAPETHSAMEGATLFAEKKTLYAGAGLKFALTASDLLSGVEQVYISVDSGAFAPYTAPLVCDKEKKWRIAYYSVDNVGNPEQTVIKTFIVDLTAPTTQLTTLGNFSNNILSGNAALKLSSEDNLSGIKKILYSIDGKAEQLYTSPVPMIFISEGEHTFSYRAIDNVNNKETKQDFTFFVDKTPPMVIDELLGDSYFVNGKEYTSGRTKLKLTAVDNKAGVKEIRYTVDGKNYNTYTEPFYMPNNQGNLAVQYYASDNVNNISGSTQSANKQHITYMDMSGPRLSYQYIGATFRNRDTVFIGAKTGIVLYGRDDESGLHHIEYAINNEKTEQFKEAFYIKKAGKYEVSYTGYDNVNNSNRSRFNFVVDEDGPEIFERFSIDPISRKFGDNVYPSYVVLFLSATDSQSGLSKIYYSINGSKMQPYLGLIQGLQKNSKYKVKVKGYDMLGNEKEKSFTFYTGD